ncbi:ImmA/IrrE family metallo-endopeptidase [Rhizobium leguminosarum]|uniref:ImmA/IrrE family metallo-endopeptidase n=1 Tax=Rhizobium leguminosarum TaxID=384 RepID=UPI001C96AE2E|nr:ImmA/IrrE family metallo-endopeptidase [Rhizobium leguminosarum]MBY5904740.1 ImmA/IrrE family metallo-endopeptidase [Rhizobium leguminosarum]MBY5911831.1 ImmA/IrrE family metallo-endopeptidase [Rhizobium leguminosarum]
MDELSVVSAARTFISKCGPPAQPISVETYAAAISGTIRKEALNDGEDGWSFKTPKGKFKICVNCNQNDRRQRFTVCHEVAHAILDIAPDHSQPSWSFSKRPQGEIFCDIFAAELLLPYKLFKPQVDMAEIGMAAVSTLADDFGASLLATGSRFATFSKNLCAFVVSEGGKVRYSARSANLRQAKGWIRPGSLLSEGCYSARARAGEKSSGPQEAEADEWFEDLDRDGGLFEDVLHVDQWDQTLTLLWYEEDDAPPRRLERKQWEEEAYGLRELDGNLPWPGSRKRR